MLRKLKDLFGSGSLLDTAYETTLTMLEFDHEMFRDSRKSLRESDSAELPYDFKQADRRINKFEREVRRQVVAHLAVAPQADLVGGLVLVTVVIDVERIGDYTKNIADLALQKAARLDGREFEERLSGIEDVIAKQFPAVIEVMRERNSEMARDILRDEYSVAKQSEAIVTDLIARESVGTAPEDMLRLALYSRHLKRINAHLTNIASSVVNPFPRIGFREKVKKK